MGVDPVDRKLGDDDEVREVDGFEGFGRTTIVIIFKIKSSSYYSYDGSAVECGKLWQASAGMRCISGSGSRCKDFLRQSPRSTSKVNSKPK